MRRGDMLPSRAAWNTHLLFALCACPCVPFELVYRPLTLMGRYRRADAVFRRIVRFRHPPVSWCLPYGGHPRLRAERKTLPEFKFALRFGAAVWRSRKSEQFLRTPIATDGARPRRRPTGRTA